LYRWEGALRRDIERQVVIKTVESRVGSVRARLAELHSYQLPEFLVIPVIDGTEKYLAWIGAESADPQAAS